MSRKKNQSPPGASRGISATVRHISVHAGIHGVETDRRGRNRQLGSRRRQVWYTAAKRGLSMANTHIHIRTSASTPTYAGARANTLHSSAALSKKYLFFFRRPTHERADEQDAEHASRSGVVCSERAHVTG